MVVISPAILLFRLYMLHPKFIFCRGLRKEAANLRYNPLSLRFRELQIKAAEAPQRFVPKSYKIAILVNQLQHFDQLLFEQMDFVCLRTSRSQPIADAFGVKIIKFMSSHRCCLQQLSGSISVASFHFIVQSIRRAAENRTWTPCGDQEFLVKS